MAHLTNKRELLRDLRKRLDCNAIGLPEDVNIYEILSILFTNDEAKLASMFPLEPCTIKELEITTGMSSSTVNSLLDNMMNKGLVLESKKHGQYRYMLSMALVGFFEFIFMRSNQSLPIKRLAELIHEYRLGTKFTKEFFNPNTPRARALIHESTIQMDKTEVLTFEYATELVKEAGRGALTKCYCRHESYHLGLACGYPIEDICISLGSASDYLVERGFARRATIDEILEKLNIAKDLGLMHICDNVMHNIAFICNCCGCCCCFLAGITKHHLPYAVLSTNYEAMVNNDICIGCGECTKRCHVKAINLLKDNVARVDSLFCLGCGVCSNFCSRRAITMKKRRKKIIPPTNMSELMIRLKNDRNK